MLWFAEVSAPPTANLPLWAAFLVAIISGGVLQVLYSAYRRWRSGASEDALEIAKAARDQSANSSQLWSSYRVELEDAKAQMAQYLDQLIKVNRELGAAMARIAKLEDELRQAHGESQQLRSELEHAKARRDQLLAHVEELNDRIATLEGKA